MGRVMGMWQNGAGSTYAERRLRRVSLRAKICTVPLSLEAHRKEESWLKLMLEDKPAVMPTCHVIWGCWPITHTLCSPVEGGRVSASPQFHQFLLGLCIKKSNKSAFLGGRGHYSAWLV